MSTYEAMANNQNLKPFTKENAAEMGRKGGIASGKTRLKQMWLKAYLYVMYKRLESGEIKLEKNISVRDAKRYMKSGNNEYSDRCTKKSTTIK